MIQIPNDCPRGRADCNSLARIVSDTGESFVCCGLNDGDSRVHKNDIFRHCWVTPDDPEGFGCNEMNDCDRRDLTDTISVLAQALSAYNHMQNNGEIA